MVFSMYQKEEYALPAAIANQRNLSKKASSEANTKKQDVLRAFKNGLTFK